MNVDMAMTYLDFVVERHRIWEKRQRGEPGPWTDDRILDTYKFTNVFRAIDYGSQFLIKELLYGEDSEMLTLADTLARCYLYRMTNRPDVWRYTKETLGAYPVASDIGEDLAGEWTYWRDQGNQVFSGAYVIMPRPGVYGVDKTVAVVELAEDLMNPFFIDRFAQAKTMRDRFEVLRAQPAVGDFIAMQVLTDYGYSRYGGIEGQDENEFVVPGPGCRKGAKEVFPDKSAEYAIQWAQEAVWEMEDCPIVQGRKPSLMDIQNTWCEFSKYARYMRKPLPNRDFKPAHPGKQEAPFLPPHWS